MNQIFMMSVGKLVLAYYTHLISAQKEYLVKYAKCHHPWIWTFACNLKISIPY